MMKRIALGAVLMTGVVLAGCIVPSVYPFYFEKQLTFDPVLTGSWVSVSPSREDPQNWTFEKTGEFEYKYITVSGNDTNTYSAHLFKVKNYLFLDGLALGDPAGWIPPHFVARVLQMQPTLKMTTLNPDWVESFLKTNPSAIRHIVAYDNPSDTNSRYHNVLTADTKELQKFILKHCDDTNAFYDLPEMKRP